MTELPFISEPRHAAGPGPVIIPDVALRYGADGYGLGRVDDAPSPDRKDELDSLVLAELDSFVDLAQLGIGLDPGEFEEAQAGSRELGDDLVVQARGLDASAAGHEKDLTAEDADRGADVRERAFPEEYFGAVPVAEIEHSRLLAFCRCRRVAVTRLADRHYTPRTRSATFRHRERARGLPEPKV
jgi:hypothetical protein